MGASYMCGYAWPPQIHREGNIPIFEPSASECFGDLQLVIG